MGWGGLETTKNPEVVPGWGCWGDFYKTKISKINVDFIKKRKKLCIYSRPRNGSTSSTSFLKAAPFEAATMTTPYTLSAFISVSRV
jgi:hypothetical protein